MLRLKEIFLPKVKEAKAERVKRLKLKHDYRKPKFKNQKPVPKFW